MDDEAKLTLHGLQQHYVKLKDAEKNRKLFELLDVLEFNQVVIFVKSVQRCMALAQLLIEQNFPAIAIHRGMAQEERLSRYQQFKDFQKVRLVVQLNKYKTDPYFLQYLQSNTQVCLNIRVFCKSSDPEIVLPVLPVLQIKTKTILWSQI